MRMVILFSCLFIADWAGAQVLNVSAGTDLTIIGGTVFRAEDLTLTPSANYVITNNSLTRSATILHASSNAYISKVYQFANSTNPYSGSLQINFSDGAELNGIP